MSRISLLHSQTQKDIKMHRLSRCAAGAAALLCVGAAPALAAPTCNLGNGVKHIVYLQFDNVHLRRDKPEVPSDLEQIPSLLNFMTQNGTLLNNHHTPLISHTSIDIMTSLTGVYGEKFGTSVGNSFGFFDPNGVPHIQSTFAYWTDLVNEGTTATPKLVPEFVDQDGDVHPAPWVPFTRAGCDVGAFSIANLEFENTGSDINNVFGPSSPEATEVTTDAASSSAKVRAQPAADFEGIAIHCAKGSTLCGGSAHAGPDVLNDEPGGYTGFQALFGNKYVAPAINSGQGFVTDVFGTNHVADSFGNDGFPTSFDPTAAQSLGYVAQMLEAGVPVVYFYIEDAHDNHNFPGAPSNPDGTFGPGEAGYVFQLQAYDAAFKAFFARLAKDGITPANTLFVITADENDHFAGSIKNAVPSNCDGIHTPCTYPTGAKGEVDADLSLVYATEFSNTTPFLVHSDDAPTVYINTNPAPTATVTRTLEQQAGKLNGFDPIIGGDAAIAQALADPAEMALLHMITHDPNRTPNFVLFGNPDYFLSASGHTTPLCTPATDSASCFSQPRSFAWNHGDFQRDIVRTWLGVVGPGIRHFGLTDQMFTDHTDIRPTILSLAKLKDDYAHDGRVLFEIMNDKVLPDSLRDNAGTLHELAEAYKAINAPTGTLGIRTLTGISTQALESTDPKVYARLEDKITDLTQRRNAIASKMIDMLEDAAFDGKEINEHEARELIDQAEDLLNGDHDRDDD
jgi:hypothetical protein